MGLLYKATLLNVEEDIRYLLRIGGNMKTNRSALESLVARAKEMKEKADGIDAKYAQLSEAATKIDDEINDKTSLLSAAADALGAIGAEGYDVDAAA
jgi:uncharacterized coiled-coil DUF342 family protein